MDQGKQPLWGELVGGTRHYPVHKYQAEILSSTARITFAFAGTGGGKTCLAPLWLISQITKNGGRGRYLVVSPTYKTFKQSQLLDKFREAVSGTQLQGTYNKTDAIYTCATGAEVFFRSGDSPDSLEGGQYDGLVLDEAAKLSYDAWIKASSRVGQKSGPILGVTTPDLNSWIHTDIFQLCDAVPVIYADGSIRSSLDGKTKVVQWQSTVNPTYSIEELERQRLILPDAIFRRRYLGEFARLEGLVYDCFAERVIEEELPAVLPSVAVKVAAGIDWGWNDPMSCIVGVECQDGRIYVVEEMYEQKLGLDELAEKLTRLKNKWNIEDFYCDHSRPEVRDQLRRYGLPVRLKKVAQIETGIAMVDTRLRTDYLKVYMACKNLIDEASRYQRKSDKDGDYDEKPIDKNNHCLDALRYLVTGLDYGRKLNFSVTPEAKADPEAVTLAAEIRLGRSSADPEERRILKTNMEIQRYAAWQLHMMNCEDD